MANGRTHRKFKNPRMNPKVVSQTIAHVKDSHVVNTGRPDDEGFFETVERRTKNPMNNSAVDNVKNGYKEFESLMNDLKNGGDIDSIKSKLKGDFRNSSQKYIEKYIKENYKGNQYEKDVDVMFDGDPNADGFYESVENVNNNRDADLDFVDVERDADGRINIDKLADDISSGNTRTINGRVIINNKERQVKKNQQTVINKQKNIKNQSQHKQNLNRKINGANGSFEFEELINRRRDASRIKELDKIINNPKSTFKEIDAAIQELNEIKNKKAPINKKANDLYDASQKVNSKDPKERKKARKKIKKEYTKDPQKYDELLKIGKMNAEEARLQKEYDELKKRASDKTLSKKERKKARRELVNHEFYNGGLDNYRKKIIQNTDRGIVDDFLDKKYNINQNLDEYQSFMDDLDLVGKDFVDIDGNIVSSRQSKINTTLSKFGKKVKGFFKGDYSEYDEYVEALERLENMNPRDFKFYDTDNLFDSNGHLNNADDIDNLKPVKTTSAKDAFDDWQTNRKNAWNRYAGTSTTKSNKGMQIAKENLLKSRPNAKKLFTVQGAFGTGLNLFNTIATYKEERKEGKGVVNSLARAGIDFALGEALGMKYLGIMAAQALPRVAVKGIETAGKLTREKNNMQRHEAFGYASFQDTQQLATMRQSGMEMAKMANYNLQQTLMGNEAKYLHR